MAKAKSVSLTEGSLPKLIFNFAWPVFISHIFSELYNITNSLIVGNYVSLEALSAVSASTWICNIFNYTFYGIGMGAGIIVGRYYGARDYDNLKKTIDTSMVFSFLGGIIITIISELLLPQIMNLAGISADIFEYTMQYLRVYILGSTAVLTSQMCFFMLRSFGDTKHQLHYSIISSIVNVILGVLFVRVFKMPIIGTALATIISQFVLDVLALNVIFNYDEVNFDIRNIDFSFELIGRIFALGIPAGFQNMLIAVSSIMVHSFVNQFSNEVIAGIGVAEKIANWAQLFSVSVSGATMSLVAQNLGAEKYDRVKESISASVIISTVMTVLSIVIIYIFAPYLVARFNDNLNVIRYGSDMIRYSIFSMFFINLSHIYNAANRAAGNVRFPMYIAIFGQCICKYLFVMIGLKLYYDVHILYLGTAFGFTVSGILATVYFYTSNWVKEHHMR